MVVLSVKYINLLRHFELKVISPLAHPKQKITINLLLYIVIEQTFPYLRTLNTTDNAEECKKALINRKIIV